MHSRTLTVLNIKGGVGKTTTVVNMAAGLGLRGRRVLVIDADPQANMTFAFLGAAAPAASMYDVLLTRTATLAEVIVPTNAQGVDLAPAQIGLSAADLVLAAVPGREKRLARQLRSVEGYDYILIDTPPSLGMMSVNSITAADEVIVPVGIGSFALLGIKLLEDTIDQVKENLEMDTPVISGAVVTMYDRTRVADDTVAALKGHFGDRLFDTVIPKYKDIPESQSRAMTIFQYAPGGQAARAYATLVEEVIHGER